MPILGFNRFAELAATIGKIEEKDPGSQVLVCRELPQREQLLSLAPSVCCKSCGPGTLGVVAAHINPPAAALMCRCQKCLEAVHLFISRKDTTNTDLAIFPGSSKSQYYQDLFNQFKCPKCKERFPELGLDRSQYDYVTILPIVARCDKCGTCFNILFWDNPLTYFSCAFRIGDKVSDVSPEAALVFYVSGLESLLQKAFVFASRFNHFLVAKRKVSFQDLNRAAEIYKAFFNLDLKQLASKAWQPLVEAVRKRNCVLHNAGHDQQFNPIQITIGEIGNLRNLIWDFVDKGLDPELKRLCVY